MPIHQYESEAEKVLISISIWLDLVFLPLNGIQTQKEQWFSSRKEREAEGTFFVAWS